jgi:hypothetical protein
MPDTHEMKIWRILVPGQPMQKVGETPISTNMLDVITYVIPAMQEA